MKKYVSFINSILENDKKWNASKPSWKNCRTWRRKYDAWIDLCMIVLFELEWHRRWVRRKCRRDDILSRQICFNKQQIFQSFAGRNQKLYVDKLPSHRREHFNVVINFVDGSLEREAGKCNHLTIINLLWAFQRKTMKGKTGKLVCDSYVWIDFYHSFLCKYLIEFFTSRKGISIYIPRSLRSARRQFFSEFSIWSEVATKISKESTSQDFYEFQIDIDSIPKPVSKISWTFHKLWSFNILLNKLERLKEKMHSQLVFFVKINK